MNTVTTKRDLLENCRNAEYREALVFENVYTSICSQIRVLREQRELSQSAFGRKVKMAQERISILEDPNAETKPALKTLLRVASGFDVGLDVRFVPFGAIIDRSVDTDSLKLRVASFDEELPELEKQLQDEERQKAATTTAERQLRELKGGAPLTANDLEHLRQYEEGRKSIGPLSYTLTIKPGTWSTLQPAPSLVDRCDGEGRLTALQDLP